MFLVLPKISLVLHNLQKTIIIILNFILTHALLNIRTHIKSYFKDFLRMVYMFFLLPLFHSSTLLTMLPTNRMFLPCNSGITDLGTLQLVFIDIWGPSPVCASNGSRYYISLLDAYSRYTWLFLISHKSHASIALSRFKIFAENQTGYKLKAIQTNNAKEFLSFKQFTTDFGIHHRLICPHTRTKWIYREKAQTHY